MIDWLLGKKKKKNNLGNIVEKNLSTNLTHNNGNVSTKKLLTLLILDGFGVHPDSFGNAVIQAKTPFLDKIWTNGTSTLIEASGTFVGLPQEEPGNSEVGHLNIGAGQVVKQSLPQINEAIVTGKFADLENIKKAFDEVIKRKSKLHLIGILSAGGVHGHIEHLLELMKICKARGVDPCVHAFLDGRDTGMTDGYFYVSKLVQEFKELGVGKLASMIGRFYAMDRDNRWERTQLAYEAMVGAGKRSAKDAFAILQTAYSGAENDQIFVPTTLQNDDGSPVGAIENDDVVIFYNFREDRARQLTRVFVSDDFPYFERVNLPKNLFFVTMTGYESDLNTHIIFPPKKIENCLAQVISEAGLKQLHVSETEKYAHVTYFFNAGIEKAFEGERRQNVPSPKVFDYAKVPEMSAEIVTDQVVYALDRNDVFNYSLIVANLANPDMVGHTGDLQKTIEANEFVNDCTKRIVEKTIELGGACIVIADHGNCETMINRLTKQIDTAHTNNPVPFILVESKDQLKGDSSANYQKIGTGPKAVSTGILADVAPTILDMLGITPPASMTGISLRRAI